MIALIPPKAYGYSRNRESFKGHTGITFDPISAAEASAKHTLSLLLNAQRLARLQQQSNVLGKDHKGIPSVAELFEEVLDQTIKQTDSKGLSLLVQQRINQQVVEHLLTLWHKKQLVTEVRSEVYVALVELSSWLNEKATSRKFKQQKRNICCFLSKLITA